MYVATPTKVFKITASYVIEQTASNANADVIAGKTFSALATIRDEVIFVGTTTGEVFYYTPNDVIYLEQLLVGATTAIVGLVCTD